MALNATEKAVWSGISTTDEQDALSNISRMLTGTKMLQDEPGVVYSLAAQQAHPQDAQAIDQFMQALDAEKQVDLARASIAQGGAGYINLSPQQQQLLQANGVQYEDVLYTSAGAAQQAAKRIQDLSGGKLTAATNSDGTLKLNASGNIVAQPVVQPKKSGGGGNWFTNAVGDVGSAFATAGKGTWSGLTKAYNFVNAGMRGEYADQLVPRQYTVNAVTNADATQAQDMEAQGYNPNSIWSTFAFGASGKAHTDLTSLNDQYGEDKVNQAIKFLDDPKAYRDGIIGDPGNFVTGSDGQEALTPSAAAQLEYLNSKDFRDLALKINAQDATVGNGIANMLHIDPVEHSTTYNLTAAGANIAASFFIDPTAIALGAVKVAKLSSVGLDTLGDSNKAASILTRSSKLPWVNNVQRGWQRAIDLGEQMRQADSAGDTEQLAKLAGQFNAELPGLSPIMGEFIGKHAVTGMEQAVENGAPVVKYTYGETGGIKSLADAADWIRSKDGLLLLSNGRAATQSSLMPGALSAFGYRKLKGLTAAWMTGRSATRASKAYGAVLSQAEADPELASQLVSEGVLRQMPAEANDAIAPDGTVLAQPEPTQGLASEARGGLAVTNAGKGQVTRALRGAATNTALDDLIKANPASLGAIAARSRLAAQRLSTLLPRNTLIDLDDPRAADTIRKFGLTYLNRGDANALMAAWNLGDYGQKKAIISGIIDQVGHAAGLGKTPTGKAILDRAKTAVEDYSASGNDIQVDGQDLALFEGQTRKTWMLPTFQALHQAASKFGLWEATMGRGLTTGAADMLMSQWKMGALFKPSTVTRNLLEGGLRTALDGKAGAAIKARALLTTRNKELWDRRYGLDDRELYTTQRGIADTLSSELAGKGFTRAQRAEKSAQLTEARNLMASVENKPIVQHLLATEAGDTDLARQIEQASALSGQLLGRGRTTNWLANTAALSTVGKAYRALVGKFMSDEDINAFLTLGPQEINEAMEGYGQQLRASDMGFKHAANEATDYTKLGYGASLVRWAVHHELSRAKGEVKGTETAWTHQALDGTEGIGRYANALARVVNKNPETAKAIIAHLATEDPTEKGHALQGIIDGLSNEAKSTSFGHLYFPDPINAPNRARRAATDEEREAGKLDWANKVAEEYRYLLTGQNGVYQQEIADYIAEHGEAPNADWIGDHISGHNRPESALAPKTMPLGNGGIKSLPTMLQDIEGGAYQWFVERPLQRLMSSPVFMANYTIARKGLNRTVDKLVEQGFSPEAANNFAKELSVKQAWVKTEQLIDDPGQKTQFDVIARNMFPFARATQAMIRRWGTGLWQNPVAARKFMLAYEGAVHSGLIYDNVYGEPTFTYPGSGVMNMMLRGVAELPGFESVASFPVSASMTGGVLMSVPGADNPLRMSMGPMISVPIREVYKHILPTSWQGEALKLDSFINGPVGAGETFQQFVPTAVRKFYTAFNADQRNSAMASAMNGALANLAAAGMIPATEDANTPAVMQQFRGRLQTQVKSQLFLRAAFGLFAPAAPSAPGEGLPETSADFAWQLDGISQLSDEYKAILNETGGDLGRANAVWTAMHPDEVVYKNGATQEIALPGSAFETSRSGSNAKGAYLPSTDAALNWLTTNQGFVDKYNSVAAYFLPQSSTNEPFSDAAYQAQLELGLRIRKTPQEFLNDVYLKHAESLFYPTVQKFDLMVNNAKAAGDTELATQITAEKSQWEKEYKALNPLLGAKMDDYAGARAIASTQLNDLRDMAKNNATPDGYNAQLVTLLKAWDNYEQFRATNSGSNREAVAARSEALTMFNNWAQGTLAGTPLASVYNGVFRVLDTNLTQIQTGATA